MPSHEQRGGPSDEPTVPTDVCQPGRARPSRHVRVPAAGLGVAAELSPLCPPEQPTPHPRQSRPSTQRQTLSGTLAPQPHGVHLTDGLQEPRTCNPIGSAPFKSCAIQLFGALDLPC